LLPMKEMMRGGCSPQEARSATTNNIVSNCFMDTDYT
jgi:hypothetical protein